MVTKITKQRTLKVNLNTDKNFDETDSFGSHD